MPGVVRYAYVVALDKHGEQLGNSSIECIEPPTSLEGDYEVIVPLLEDAKLMHGDYIGFSNAEYDDDADFGLAEPIDVAPNPANPEELQQVPDMKTTLMKAFEIDGSLHSDGYAVFVVEAFAVFGLVAFVRLFYQRTFRRRGSWQASIA